MTARILVVDDVLANVRLLDARLSAEYFDVTSVQSGHEALAVMQRSEFDLVLLDVMMPGIDGFEVCRKIKTDPRTTHVPVIMVTALDQVADRVRGLEAGADDFLTKPIGDLALITRVKSLVRLKQLTDELHMRGTVGRFGLDEPLRLEDMAGREPGRILLVTDRAQHVARVVTMLASEYVVAHEGVAQEALFKAADGSYDLVIVDLEISGSDPLRLCAQLRSLERTRMLPILLVSDPDDNARLLRGLDLGVNDYVVRPVDRHEMLARVRTQVRRKRYNDRLRDNVALTMEMAVMDTLTGLYNRRYLENHLPALVEQAVRRDRPLSLMVLDIDHFKLVNDRHGHDAGDEVLREFSRRLRRNIRGIDLACRHGGEEFVVVMPDTDADAARAVAERILGRVADQDFALPGARALGVTVSIGISSVTGSDETPASLLKRADVALYRAKSEGRNRVAAAA